MKLEFWNSYLYCDVHSFDSCSDSETERSAEATLNATVALQPEVKPLVSVDTYGMRQYNRIWHCQEEGVMHME